MKNDSRFMIFCSNEPGQHRTVFSQMILFALVHYSLDDKSRYSHYLFMSGQKLAFKLIKIKDFDF